MSDEGVSRAAVLLMTMGEESAVEVLKYLGPKEVQRLGAEMATLSIISHDRMFLDRLATHMLAYEGDSHFEWFEGNFQDYEQDKIRRLGADSVNNHKVSYKRLTR